MNEQLLQFLKKLDDELAKEARQGETLDLYLLGRAALMLRFSLPLSTKDVDIVREHTPLEEKAAELFAEDSPHAKKLGLYLERVSSGLPPLPNWFRERSEDLPGSWKVIRPKLLDTHDLAASKLKPFRAKDRQDLRALCDLGQLEPDKLRESLESAFAFTHSKDDDPDRDRAFENLKRVIQYLNGDIEEI